MSKESSFLRWNLLLVKPVEMITKDLGYYINLVDRAVAGFERTDSNFESSSVGEIHSISTSAYCREIIHERKSHQCGKLQCCL